MTGRYLSQPFAATVLAADQFRPGWFRLVLDLDAAVDGSAWGRGICSSHMTRGGSWFTGTKDIRLPARFSLKNGDRNDFTGFRVVRVVDE